MVIIISLTGPSMKQQDRHRIFLLRKDGHKMDGETFHIGCELREAIDAIFGCFPGNEC